MERGILPETLKGGARAPCALRFLRPWFRGIPVEKHLLYTLVAKINEPPQIFLRYFICFPYFKEQQGKQKRKEFQILSHCLSNKKKSAL